MTLPTIHEVTSMFLYGSETPPSNFADAGLTEERLRSPIPVSTDDFLNQKTGPGRFVVASNSPLIERFFENGLAEYAAGTFDIFKDPVTGVVSMSKTQLNEVYDFERFYIPVDNKWIYDDYDDYAARTYIYGNISFTISEDARFTIHPDGRIEIEHFSLVIHGGADFDWTTRLNDILTTVGNTVLKRAIDPSGIGDTVSLAFTSPTSHIYTKGNYDDDVLRAEKFSTVLNPISISRAMGHVIDDLYDAGTIQTVMDGKLVLYGSDEADVIGPYIARTGINVSDPGLDLPNPLHEHTGDGLIYVAGAGNDAISGTSEGDVLLGGSGADSLFGGGGDDFIFFDAADGVNVDGGADWDVAVALGDSGVTVNMAAQGLECVVGSVDGDTFIMGGDGDLMAAGGTGNSSDTFIADFSTGDGLRTIWGGGGPDEIIAVSAGMLGVVVATVAGLTEENFYLFDKSMLNLGADFDWSAVDLLVLNPDAGDRIKVDYGNGTHTLNVHVASGEVIANFGDSVTGDQLKVIDTVSFMTSDAFDNDYYTSIGFYDDPGFVPGYSGSIFTRALVVEDERVIYEHKIGDTTYITDQNGDWPDIGLYGDGWNGEYDTVYDLSSARSSSDWVKIGDDEWMRAHYFQAEYENPIVGYNANWFFVGGGLSGSEIVGSGIIGNMADVNDPGPSPFDWLLAA